MVHNCYRTIEELRNEGLSDDELVEKLIRLWEGHERRKGEIGYPVEIEGGLEVVPPYLVDACRIGGERAKQYIFGEVRKGVPWLCIHAGVDALGEKHRDEVIGFLIQQSKEGNEMARVTALGCIHHTMLTIYREVRERFRAIAESRESPPDLVDAINSNWCYIRGGRL